jgi:hypothetical protein
MDNEQNDPLPKLLSDIDQALAMMGERARYDSQALYLTAQLMKMPRHPDDV